VNILLARNIFSKPWLIAPFYVESILPFVASMLEHQTELPLNLIQESNAFAIAGTKTPIAIRSNTSLDNAPKGSIAVIDIQGALMKNDQYCGPAGMESIGAWIKAADNNQNIDGIILKVDSPGGTVDGTEELGNIIRSTKKPIVGFVNGTMASAAYWIGSATDTLIANGATAHIGSIGVMMSFADLQPALEKAGVKFHEVYSSLSGDKNKGFREARQGDYTDIIGNTLDPLAQMFTDTVTKNRSGKLSSKENVLTGKMYFAKDAKKFGLIDSIGTMDDAINFIRTNSSTSKKKNMSAIKQRTHLNATLGITENHASTDEGVFLQDSELDTIEASMAASANLQADNTRLTAENAKVATLQAALDTANASLATANTRIVALEAEVTILGAQPAGSGSAPAGAADEIEKSKPAYVDDGSAAAANSFGLK
jgi:signal peptide peptidase SppA